VSALRIACLVVLCLLPAVALRSAPASRVATDGAASVAPVAFVHVGSLFGGRDEDENEPDESDDESGAARPQRTADTGTRARASSRTVLAGVAAGAFAGILAGAFVTTLMHRARSRLRAWRESDRRMTG
jgi:hypothetical protein